jgi:hypothetical protein
VKARLPDDAYSLDQYTSLVVPAGQGVLVNDRDVEEDPLTAVMLSEPAHGSVTLNPDGSFIYTPAPKFLGPDGFTYQVTDGTVAPALAKVALTVRPDVINVDSLVRVSYSGYMFNRPPTPSTRWPRSPTARRTAACFHPCRS